VLFLDEGYLVAHQAMSFGDLIVFAGVLQQFSAQVSGMAGTVNTLQQKPRVPVACSRVLDVPLEVEDPPSPRERALVLGRLRLATRAPP
jgi:ATP-binding cassette subfamily B protein